MECNRIKKLLIAEYTELARSECVLVESPFAETTRDGYGLREVALGLTKTKLIIAVDVLKAKHEFWCARHVDPCIETLELLSIYPLEFVNLSVFARKHRKVIKARLIDGRSKYYEIGGHTYRAASWSLWREFINRLVLKRRYQASCSSLSETTEAAPTSTCYALSSVTATSRYDTSKRARARGGAEDGSSCGVKWVQKDLYMGEEHSDLMDGSYKPVIVRLAGTRYDEVRDILKVSRAPKAATSSHRHRRPRRSHTSYYDHRHQLLDYHPDDTTSVKSASSVLLEMDYPDSEVLTIESTSSITTTTETESRYRGLVTRRAIRMKNIRKVSRFAFGVDEKCVTTLCAPSPTIYVERYSSGPINYRRLIDDAVKIWEIHATNNHDEPIHHLPSTSIAPSTFFLYALGPWSVQPGERISVQHLHRSHSCAAIRRQPADPSLRLPVSRRQLSASVSLQDLTRCLVSSALTSTRGRVVLFWTPDYWYRPRAAADAYKEVRSHMEMLRRFRSDEVEGDERVSCELIDKGTTSTSTTSSSCLFSRMFPPNYQRHINQISPPMQHSSSQSNTQRLRRLLRLDISVTLWNLNGSTLAQQLTLIDRELFLRIPRHELETLAKQCSSRDAPNLGAWIAFAHRVACLVASEVLKEKKMEARVRLIIRLLKAAEICCWELGNFHSARSILAGLQTPAVFRLKQTWTNLKASHGEFYETMLKLSEIFENTRTMRYRYEWMTAEQHTPYMPFVGDLITRLLLIGDGGSKKVLKSEVVLEKKGKNSAAEKRGLRNWIRKLHSPKRMNSDANSQLDEIAIYKDGKINEIANWLERCQVQARIYNFPGHSLAWEFLLKARYREDRDNFYASLLLEPPREICESR